MRIQNYLEGDFPNLQTCTGCFACVQRCPVGAISSVEDERGHRYPCVNKSMCIQCGKCLEVCPTNHVVVSAESIRYFGVQHIDVDILAGSSSGGLFYGLAEQILLRGGVCYGAVYDEDYSVIHRRVETLEGLQALQGSKYAHSDTNITFSQVKLDLQMGRPVLYSGTSCIIAGLMGYLASYRVDDALLYTCDLICAGIPGNKLFQEYLRLLETQRGSRCVQINQRDKRNIWARGQTSEMYRFEDGTELTNRIFRELYSFRVLHRPSCFQCPYMIPNSKCADITMGDFWGFEESTSKTFYDEKGCSLAIVHTEKGRELFYDGRFQWFEIATQEEALRQNRVSVHRKIRQHEQFWRDYEKKGLEYCLRKYTSQGGLPARLRRKVMMCFGIW